MKNLSALKISFIVILFLITGIFLSCKKDIQRENETIAIPEQKPDLTTKVTSSVSGFVTDQNNAPVVGATVKAGTATILTDRYGYFEIKNVQVVKEAATVTVQYPGYFKGIKTYMAAEGKSAFFRITLLQKTIAGTINAVNGGSVSLSNGTNISFPANGIKDASGAVSYTGTVNVAVQYIDPTSAELNNVMPGDLRGINTEGYIKGLTSFGMMSVELTGAGGELLNVADGKRSTITMPLPASISSQAPPTIPLWHFDEDNGLWKEEGTATKTGNAYVGEVSHFSSWNCDLPNATIPLTFTVVDTLGKPIPYLCIQIVPTTNSWAHVWGNTDESGYVSVSVTPNTQYQLFISSNYSSFFSINSFSVGSEAVALGNIIIGGGTAAYLHGTVTDCNNNILPGGRIIISNGSQYCIQHATQDGTFDFIAMDGTNATNISIIGEDLNTAQQSATQTYTLTPGSNTTANIQACGVSSEVYLDFNINGRTFIWNPVLPSGAVQDNINGIDSLITNVYWVTYETQNGLIIPNSTSNLYFSFWSFGDALNPSTDHFIYWIRPFNNIFNYSMHGWPLSWFNHDYKEVRANITEYGAIGGFIAGSFSGRFYEDVNLQPDLTRPYDVSCSFRIRRD